MLVLLLALIAGQAAMPADLSRGCHLYGSCQAAARLSDDPASAQAKSELASSTYCFGYIGGYMDGLNVLKEQVCIRGASLDTIARVYVLYMQRNPKLMDEGRALGLLLSLKSSYACLRPELPPMRSSVPTKSGSSTKHRKSSPAM